VESESEKVTAATSDFNAPLQATEWLHESRIFLIDIQSVRSKAQTDDGCATRICLRYRPSALVVYLYLLRNPKSFLWLLQFAKVKLLITAVFIATFRKILKRILNLT